MSYLDDLKTTTSTQITTSTVAPQKEGKSRAGYFDWDKHAKNNEAVGVILPPYATWLQERIVAIRSGAKFDVPFYLAHGIHAIGPRQGKDKVFVECRKTIMEDNAVGSGHGLVHPSAAAGGDECPICAACWNDVWPKCKEYEGNKNSPEYKTYREAHRQLCPQQKYLINFLPMGSTEPVILDAAKTLGDQLKNIHYDPKQPDLLFPFANPPHFMSAWVQIRREVTENATKYLVNTIYVGMPHILNPDNTFNQQVYESVVAKVPDLRELSKSMVPDAASLAKAITKTQQVLVNFGLAVQQQQQIVATVAAATAGVAGSSVSAPPAAIQVPATVVVGAPPAAAAPVLPPAMGGMTQPAPVAPARSPIAGNDSTAANDLLASLLNKPQ